MCIVFICNDFNNPDSDYSLILATNRDECFDRNARIMGPWEEDPNIIGGRGQIVAEYIKKCYTTDSYLPILKEYGQYCNGFIFVTVEFSNDEPIVRTYTNATKQLKTWTEHCVGFSNNLPDEPLSKVKAGTEIFEKLCEKHQKVEKKEELIENLIKFLKSEDRHLPDPILEKRRPKDYHWFSSIYVSVPPVRYGTRTHTLLLVTKTGQVDLIEITMESPIDISNPVWKKSHFQFSN